MGAYEDLIARRSPEAQAKARDADRQKRAEARKDYWLRRAGRVGLQGEERERVAAEARSSAKRDKARGQSHVKRLHESRKREAMPPWADVPAIQAVYAEAQRLTAETGQPA